MIEKGKCKLDTPSFFIIYLTFTFISIVTGQRARMQLNKGLQTKRPKYENEKSSDNATAGRPQKQARSGNALFLRVTMLFAQTHSVARRNLPNATNKTQTTTLTQLHNIGTTYYIRHFKPSAWADKARENIVLPPQVWESCGFLALIQYGAPTR